LVFALTGIWGWVELENKKEELWQNEKQAVPIIPQSQYLRQNL
jgi:hypothetical protein